MKSFFLIIQLTFLFNLINCQVFEVWQSHLIPPTGTNTFNPKKLLADPQNNIYAIYESEDTVYIENCILITGVDGLTGNILWKKTVDTTHGNEYFWDAICYDSSLLISNTGIFNRPTIRRISSNGNELWNFSINYNANPISLTTDENGDIYTSLENYGIEVLKLNQNGNLIYSFRNDTLYPDSGYMPRKIIVDPDYNIYIAGNYFAVNFWDKQFFLKKFNPSGQMLWERKFNPGTNDEVLNIHLDDSCNIYLTGTESSFMSDKYSAVKYDSAGNQKWSISYGGMEAVVHSSVCDSSDYLYLAGRNIYSSTNADYEILKINIHNGQFSIISIDSSTNNPIKIVQKNQNLYAGFSQKQFGSGLPDFITEKFEPGGNKAWSMRYNDSLNGYDGLSDICLMENDVVVFGGTQFGSTIIKYGEITNLNFYPKQKSISLFPNPVYNSMEIEFNFSLSDIAIHNLTGMLIWRDSAPREKLTIPGLLTPGYYILSGFSEGIKYSSPLIILNK